ncbi:uncharacterized protein LOC121697317 [Alosa sapidissima]|uniref:uncharacterized protein LOC121697317 n=1 Tax=Alosa sapidissima TaxID=34773 RepID=UPI001C0A1798|nr:uncharacterized protein LOC121697317 [Alosa sapidissima]
MWLFFFFTCCLAVRQDEDGDMLRLIKKRVKKYSLEQLTIELEALDVPLNNRDNESKSRRKVKKELQKLLITEELRRATYAGPEIVEEKRQRPPLPFPIPDDTLNVLKELDALDSKNNVLDSTLNYDTVKTKNPQSYVRVEAETEHNENGTMKNILVKVLEPPQGLNLGCADHANKVVVDKMAKDDVDNIRKISKELGTGEGKQLSQLKMADERAHPEGLQADGEKKTSSDRT